MDTNGYGAGRAEEIVMRSAKSVRHGVVLYGQALSSDGRTQHLLKKVRLGTNRFHYACTCPGSFLGGALCRHIDALKQVETKL